MSATKSTFGVPGDYPALPTGRHPLPREYVDYYQRRRLVVAVAEVCHEKGLGEMTVSALCTRARISRKTFYEYFANRDACATHAGEVASEYLFAGLEKLGSEEAAEARIASGVEALLEAVAAEPIIAEFGLIHAPTLRGDAGRRFQEAAIEAIAGLIGASGGKRGEGPAAETIAIAILGLISYRVRCGEAEQVAELREEVMRLARLAESGTEYS